MAIQTTIKKKEEEEDERTVNATEFINRLTESQRTTRQYKDIPKTEMPK
ncbi:MAG: hypothetical protein Q4E63_03680 [Prevotellaceae bacterium]|nr:hypothetical protein [Prevotellaceae bacterium]MDO4931742.1 hypothetical protein [Prevotellaceae bacterium]